MIFRSAPRRGFTVALVGADGAGKTTVAAALRQRLPMAIRYLYMGVNAEAANRLLPTTLIIRAVKRALKAEPDAGGPPEPAAHRPHPVDPGKRLVRSTKSAVRLANQVAEETYRQLLVRSYLRGGSVVLLDRDFFADYHAYDIAGGAEQPLSQRVHGFFLTRLYRRPDLVIFLDAPGDVLFARKGEGSVEALERRRGDYLALSSVMSNFVVVDANQSLEQVIEDVAHRVEMFAAASGDERISSSRRQPR